MINDQTQKNLKGGESVVFGFITFIESLFKKEG